MYINVNRDYTIQLKDSPFKDRPYYFYIDDGYNTIDLLVDKAQLREIADRIMEFIEQ